MHGHYQLSDNNPNDQHGGGGCILNELKQQDCEGPYFCYYSNEMASNLSPIVVVCASHVRDMFDDLDAEQISVGERGFEGVIEATAEDDDEV